MISAKRMKRGATFCLASFMAVPLSGNSLASLQPQIVKVNSYRDNPSFSVDRRVHTQFSVVGELERITKDSNGAEISTLRASAIIISPCHIITNHHVAFGYDLRPVDGKNYTMTFRGGVGRTGAAFLGRVDAYPVVWGNMDLASHNDWAIMRLKRCVGTMEEIGWSEVSTKSQSEIIGQGVFSVGFSYKFNRGNISLSHGIVTGIDKHTRMLRYTASADEGQSGGAVFCIEDGVMRLVGLDTGSILDKKDPKLQEYDYYDDEHANLFQSVSEILGRSDIKQLLDADKAAYGAENPALSRLSQPIPKPEVPRT